MLTTALILPWLLIAAGAWFVYEMFRQYGKALIGLDEIRTRLLVVEQELATMRVQPVPAAPPPSAVEPGQLGLTVGTRAPEFTLPDLDGEARSLSDYRGAPVLLVFFSPTCGWCTKMAPQLGALDVHGPRVVLVSSGDPDEHRRLAAEHGWNCDVLLDQQAAVMMAYGGRGTPTGYLVDAEGRVASELAMGAEALIALHEELSANGSANGSGVELTPELLQERAAAVAARAREAGMAVKDPSESRLVRDGLPAGTPAPDFTLPDLKGTRRSLKRLRGKRVLLVFSDVECGPCQALAPDLKRLRAERGDDLEVVMVSRGDPEKNRLKAREHGLEFPVLLQRSWEVSKDYGMFATPIAYLIDEEGVIAKDVAVGANAILELANVEV